MNIQLSVNKYEGIKDYQNIFSNSLQQNLSNMFVFWMFLRAS